jgi:hypothetical protein
MSDLKQALIKVKLDYAPKENGKEFTEWCKKHDFYPLNSGRRAWCSQLSTYFRDALGVAYNSGEMFLFYEEDLAEPQPNNVVSKHHIDATPDGDYPLRILQSYRDDCDIMWTDSTSGSEPMNALYKAMNEHQKQRAVVLDKAITKLATPPIKGKE